MNIEKRNILWPPVNKHSCGSPWFSQGKRCTNGICLLFLFPYLSQFTGWYWFPRCKGCKGSNHFSFRCPRMPQKPLVAHRQPSWCRRSMKKWSRPMLDLSTLAVKEVQNWYGLLRYILRCDSRIGATLFDFDCNTSWFLGFSFHLLLESRIRNLVWKCFFDWWTKWLEPFVEAARCCFRCQPHLNPRYSCTLEFLNKKTMCRKSDSSCPLLSTVVHPFVALLCSRFSVTSMESTQCENWSFQTATMCFFHVLAFCVTIWAPVLGFLDLH